MFILTPSDNTGGCGVWQGRTELYGPQWVIVFEIFQTTEPRLALQPWLSHFQCCAKLILNSVCAPDIMGTYKTQKTKTIFKCDVSEVELYYRNREQIKLWPPQTTNEDTFVELLQILC